MKPGNGKVNIGIIGMGNMGQLYMEQLSKMDRCQVVSIWSQKEEKVRKLSAEHQVQGYTDYIALLDAGDVDAVILATPHYQHTQMAIEALRRNIHVLVEKPVAAHTRDAERMITAHEEQKRHNPDLVFAAIHQQRTNEHWRKVKEMIQDGKFGKLMRYSWINTGWFRPQAYFNVGNWRGTWSGEGGGVLLNQCAHNLDILWWLFGLPQSITATASFGKYHHIEVEDEVQALLQHDGGLVGSFIASTAECPGTDRLEIVGEHGKLVYENKKIVMHINEESALDYIQQSQRAFGTVKSHVEELEFAGKAGPGHEQILEDFVQAILERRAPLVPAAEGLNSLMIINGMVLSALRESKIRLPLDGGEFERTLQSLIEQSTYSKPVTDHAEVKVDVKDSFR
ncbi:Gfo/Idh/MocA family protein [Paenibacillus allorhizosphaerae]|uniref:Inositol 2-dehydrogenase/D-chiro-inositol 3-dehydrogenase n=1 Tax=Paenibacillus allorhizosphaerae TaxID=2849866 RepID=A0ABM8VIU1_9BACL|nr:Gfo/Idh/MocA family oxidoreductase [Paenibacillus allorhizosphaerae]CAG7644532.1 Inositol 2-dehydrogenase/D-chiro-inositol 3-dehydrogenase [Paenibacillus allorhizosphaerae]